MMKYLLAIFCIAALGSILQLAPAQTMPINASKLFPSESAPYGIPYSEWLGKWWQYWVGIPNSEHPVPNYEPSECLINQGGPVWYLPDVVLLGDSESATQKFSCTVPPGKAIIVPVSTGSCWLGLTDYADIHDKLSADPATDSELKKCAVEPQNQVTINSARVDGIDVKDQLKRVTTPFYNLTISSEPAVDLFENIGSGTSRAIADGYFIFVPPLPTGKHIIDFSVRDFFSGRNTDRSGTYDLTVR